MKDNSVNPGFFFTLQEAASILRISTRSLHRSILEGQIRGKKVRGRHLFSKRAVIAYGLGFGPRLSASERKEFLELTD